MKEAFKWFIKYVLACAILVMGARLAFLYPPWILGQLMGMGSPLPAVIPSLPSKMALAFVIVAFLAPIGMKVTEWLIARDERQTATHVEQEPAR